MSRRRRRARFVQEPPAAELRGVASALSRLADLEVLDHSARRFSGPSTPLGPVRYLIRTGPDGSRRLPAQLAGVSRSSDVGARASLRSQSVSGSPMFRRALDCAHRSIRKEVLFAFKLTGRGARGPRRRSFRSVVKCR